MQNTLPKLIIAIDGFSSSGKSTIAKSLAHKLGFIYIDTGAMYRAITLKLISNNIDFDDLDSIKTMLKNTKINFSISDGCNCIILDDKNVENKIRGLDVADNVSEVAVIPEIRDYLVEIQRELGNKGGIVMDGRDIGTVVFPNADFKFFISADIDVRANRRYQELINKGEKDITLDKVKANLSKRDKIDSGRKHSPLKIAEDAIIVNTENLTREEQLDFVIEKILSKIK